MVEHRFYRGRVKSHDLQIYEVKVDETDLLVSTDTNIYDITLNSIIKYRYILIDYISYNHSFLTSLRPIAPDPFAPQIIQDMINFSGRVGVGPMASVAGAISQYVGNDLRNYSQNVIIENGGDDYIFSQKDVIISIHAGNSPLSDKILLKITPDRMPIGICTSSGTVGHSLSYGRADAVCVMSKSAILADAVATAIGNRVKNLNCIEEAMDWGMNIPDIQAVLIIIGEKMGAVGRIELA